jgi:hypothetical protein
MPHIRWWIQEHGGLRWLGTLLVLYIGSGCVLSLASALVFWHSLSLRAVPIGIKVGVFFFVLHLGLLYLVTLDRVPATPMGPAAAVIVRGSRQALPLLHRVEQQGESWGLRNLYTGVWLPLEDGDLLHLYVFGADVTPDAPPPHLSQRCTEGDTRA